ncbi:MAG: hypothetical protein OXM55_08210 [Bdellovibrionales bacterium]|nr:hypothetical protein [Bdellovibrionales bacterium]
MKRNSKPKEIYPHCYEKQYCYSFVYGTLPFFCIFFFSACVSISFDSLKDQKAKRVVFKEPVKPYEKTVKKGMDFAWENSENGDILSFFSNCSSTDRFTALKQFRKELLDGLKSFHVLDEKEVYHQDQKAYRLNLAQISSIPQAMNINLFIFKKGDCFYALNFLYQAGQEFTNSELRSPSKTQDSNKISIIPSLEKSAINHQSVFEDFIKGFRAP